ncbi:elmo ced-12 family protein [Lentinula edodes]|uniref:Elmo ced-12 family protein n=1 Tax=Lentinula edodes TaxID=5353 RepID=A0A1Q3E203_LENED|nr:elmo ced-12 family protein [Lentinula edodes]
MLYSIPARGKNLKPVVTTNSSSYHLSGALDFATIMSNHNSLPPRSPLSSTPPTSGSQAKSGLVPTNNVTTGEGITVRARIDPTLTVADVVRQLCVNLKIKGIPSDYALRDENHELVTNDNLRKKIKARLDLKLVNSPNKEGREIAEKLQRYIRENEFASEFINYDGVTQLVDIIFTSLGNTLAYALTAMQNLMELDYGWASLDEAFIFRVVQVLSSSHSLINDLKPVLVRMGLL